MDTYPPFITTEAIEELQHAEGITSDGAKYHTPLLILVIFNVAVVIIFLVAVLAYKFCCKRNTMWGLPVDYLQAANSDITEDVDSLNRPPEDQQ